MSSLQPLSPSSISLTSLSRSDLDDVSIRSPVSQPISYLDSASTHEYASTISSDGPYLNGPLDNLYPHTNYEPVFPTVMDTGLSILKGQLSPNRQWLMVGDKNNLLKLKCTTNADIEKTIGNFIFSGQLVSSKDSSRIAFTEPGRGIVYGAHKFMPQEAKEFAEPWYRDGEIAFSADNNYLMVPTIEIDQQRLQAPQNQQQQLEKQRINLLKGYKTLENRKKSEGGTLLGWTIGTALLGTVSIGVMNAPAALLVLIATAGINGIAALAGVGALGSSVEALITLDHYLDTHRSQHETKQQIDQNQRILNNLEKKAQQEPGQPSKLIIRYLPLKSDRPFAKTFLTNDRVTFSGFSGDKRQVIIVEDNQRVTVSSLETQALGQTFSLIQNNHANAGSSSITKIISSRGANSLVAINADEESNKAGYRVQIYTLKNRGYTLDGSAHFPAAFNFSLSPDKRWLAAINLQHELVLLSTAPADLQPGSAINNPQTLNPGRLTPVHTISWTPASELVTVEESDANAARIWKIVTRNNRFLLDNSTPHQAVQSVVMVA